MIKLFPAPEATNLHLNWTFFTHAFGLLFVAWDHRGVWQISFIESTNTTPEVEHEKSEAKYHCRNWQYVDAVPAQILGLFEGAKSFPLCAIATDFQRNVWEVAISIPHGETRHYEELADALSRPDSSRAVGTALGANPFALVVPCHRVLRKSGELGGYRWGIARKQTILRVEAENRENALAVAV